MKSTIFTNIINGAVLIALGIMSLRLEGMQKALPFFQSCLLLGGGILICGLFSLKNPKHGLIGAGVLALLGIARGLGNTPEIWRFLHGEREHGPAIALEMGATLICFLLLSRIVRSLLQARQRRMWEHLEDLEP